MQGGFTNDFTAASGFAKYSDLDPECTYPEGPPTTDWVYSLFEDHAALGEEGDGDGGQGNNNDWRWVYWTCNQEWINQTDTENPLDGLDGNHGDITGTPACPTRTTPAPAPPPGTGGLADTGTNVTGIVIAGGSALLVGAALIAFTARRRARSHS